ncbi:AMP-binding protein [Leeia sp. TBRC 13508]|uniref:AMP-binding protein n=1 Tax=Leeia speluncae TaxID=2884804 RepID=A0ABS8D411_9NEIS|nr:AMP-binding protein [Leeia speluncae]MCB6182912.1 AMP-binding protein [Leeia speluncae]
MTQLPLVPHPLADVPFALLADRTISRQQFLSHVMSFSDALPNHGVLMNLCGDRYSFLVSLFAATRKGLLSVLPNSLAPEHLKAIVEQYPDIVVVRTDENPLPSQASVSVDIDALSSDWVGDSPLIPFDQTIACLFTSGSTGVPTVHFKQFGRLVYSMEGSAERLWAAAGGVCSVVGTAPFRHMYGFESSALLSVFGGGVLVDEMPFFPADIAACLAKMPAPRLLVTTPYHLRNLLESGTALPEVALILSATAPLSLELAEAVEARFQVPVWEIYGSTETGQIATRRATENALWTCLPHIRVLQNDEDTWAEGLLIERPQVINDVVELVGEDKFRFIDRKGNLVSVAGKRSSLSFLNTILLRVDGVKDGVFFVPPKKEHDEIERLAAFVVLAPNANKADVLMGLRQYIDPVFLPRPFIVVDDIPRDVNGKVLAKSLQAMITTHFAGARHE